MKRRHFVRNANSYGSKRTFQKYHVEAADPSGNQAYAFVVRSKSLSKLTGFVRGRAFAKHVKQHRLFTMAFHGPRSRASSSGVYVDADVSYTGGVVGWKVQRGSTTPKKAIKVQHLGQAMKLATSMLHDVAKKKSKARGKSRKGVMGHAVPRASKVGSRVRVRAGTRVTKKGKVSPVKQHSRLVVRKKRR